MELNEEQWAELARLAKSFNEVSWRGLLRAIADGDMVVFDRDWPAAPTHSGPSLPEPQAQPVPARVLPASMPEANLPKPSPVEIPARPVPTVWFAPRSGNLAHRRDGARPV